MYSPIDYRLLLLFGDWFAVASYTSVACSLSLSLPLASLFLPVVSRLSLLLHLCVSLALLVFRFRSLLQFTAKLIVVFSVLAH
jgi:hypothetical protein